MSGNNQNNGKKQGNQNQAQGQQQQQQQQGQEEMKAAPGTPGNPIDLEPAKDSDKTTTSEAAPEVIDVEVKDVTNPVKPSDFFVGTGLDFLDEKIMAALLIKDQEFLAAA